jgi:hypothetical protein
MSKRTLSIAAILGLALLAAGCAQTPQETGFLSTYANLQSVSSTRLNYVGPDVGNYSKFILNPVETEFYDQDQTQNIAPEDIDHLKQYMYEAIVKAMSDKYTLVSDPGPGVARIRIAITNLKASTPALNIIPQTKLTGLGLGQASVEAELVDSQSGQQLAAVIDSETGSRFSFSGLSKWGDVEAVMNDWAARWVSRLDEIHAQKAAS